MEPSQPNLRVESPLSPRERVGVRARFAAKPPSGKGCAVFHATALLGFDDGAVSTQPTRCMDRPLSLWERAGVRAPFTVKPQWKRLRRFPRYGTVGLRQCSCLNPTYALHGQPPLPAGEGWGEGALRCGAPSGKGCAVFHATAPLGFDSGAVSTQPTRCMDSPLSLRERAGVRARFAAEPPVEKAAPFSTLRHRWASTMEPSQPDLRVESPLSLRERAGVRARFAAERPVEKAAPFSTLRHRWASLRRG